MLRGFAQVTTLSTVVLMSSSLYAAMPVAVTASLDDGNIAENTLDSDLSSRWSARGVGQWIEYDLGDSYLVDALSVAFYKGDMRTATIDIDISEDGESWTTLYSGEQLQSTAELQLFKLEETAGQYLRILGYGNNANTWNSLTEVEISTVSESGNGENVALGKSTSQSSIDYSGESSRAVDGDSNGQYRADSITHTKSETQPWWQVDLASIYSIDSINIWNRTDSCCTTRLSDFYILVSDNPFTSDDLSTTLGQSDVTSIYYEDSAEAPSAININAEGRYVRVQLSGKNPLSIAEFEVFVSAETEGQFPIPGKIEAEAFSDYLDNDSVNRGGDYRNEEGVDIQINSDTDGGYNVGWMESGESLIYPISVDTSGDYTAQLRVASSALTGQLSMVIDGNKVATHSVGDTGGWQKWETHDVSLGHLSEGAHNLTINVEGDDFNLNWINIIEGELSSSSSSYTSVGGSGNIAGALSVSCDTPDGFIVVDSLSEMIESMSKSNVQVALTPGTYIVDEDDVALFTSQALPGDKNASTLFPVDGSNSKYDFRCAKIEFDTDLWEEFGRNEVIQLRTVGNENTISNLIIEDIGDTAPSGGALGVMMDGRDNLLEGYVLTSRGSQPYGLGDAYGKGGGPILSHDKHSGVLIRGLRNSFKHSTVFNYAYGHSVFMQGSEDTLIDSIYVQGELRSTADMLAANDSRFSAADKRAADVDFVTVWGYKLPTGYWMSLQEAGIRAYNGGNTVIDGVEYDRGADTVTVLNSVIRNTRTGVTLVHATGTKYVENTTAIGCESGFSIGSGNIVNSYADADVGPVLGFAYSSDKGTTADITVLPTDGSKNGSGTLAFIGGKNHNITLRSSQSNINQNLKVIISGDKQDIRHLEDALQNQDQLTATNTEINNLTNYPMLVNDKASGVSGQSNGIISGSTSGNSIQQN